MKKTIKELISVNFVEITQIEGFRVFGMLSEQEINTIKGIIKNINLVGKQVYKAYGDLNEIYRQFYLHNLNGFIIYFEEYESKSMRVCIQKVIPNKKGIK